MSKQTKYACCNCEHETSEAKPGVCPKCGGVSWLPVKPGQSAKSAKAEHEHTCKVAQAGIETQVFGVQLAQEISEKLEQQITKQVDKWLVNSGISFSYKETEAIRSNARYFFVKTLKQQWGL